MNFRKIVLFIMLAFSSDFAFATHLVGGEMTYERLSGSTIRVTLIVYRDNLSTNGNPPPNNSTPLDPNATVSFYNSNGTFLEAREYPLTSTQMVPVVLQPCQNQSINVETEKGFYVFTVNLATLNNYNANLSTKIVYGRCCRNNIIQNLNLPGDQGFSSIATVPPLNTINSSPTFDDFDQYICANREKVLDFSATDVDGDSLYYHLCDPYLGLDQNNPAADIFTLNSGGGYPNYGPPYNTVVWRSGYSATNPFGGTMNLNPNTGLMTINPSTQGIYVMGVCVSEYRNGVLLNTVTRDFQYVVTPCDYPEVIVDYNTSLGLDPTTGFGIISAKCNEGLVQFNASNSVDIVSYEWDFGVPGITTDVATGPTPSYFYADTGTFYVTVTGITSTGCEATSDSFIVFIYPIFEPDFTVQDSCLNMDVVFSDNTVSTSSNVNSWIWNFGDPSTTADSSNVQNPTYQYGVAGTFNAYLVVTTDKGCIDTAFKQITVHPLPDLDYTSENPSCVGTEVNFNNISSIQSGSIQNYEWRIDGNIFNTEDVDYVFTSAGTFPIQLIGTSTLGCMDTITQNIIINPLPVTNTTANSPICPNTNVQLSASGGTNYVWTPDSLLNNANISNPTASLDTNPVMFYVQVTDGNGCINNDSVFIDLFPLPPAEAGTDTSVCLNVANVVSYNTTVPLQATGGVSYIWTPSSGLDNPNISNPNASPTATTTYTVEVTDNNGCTAQDSVKVAVLNPALELIEVDIDSVCGGDTVYVEVLDLGNVTTYSWTPSNFVTDPSIREPGFYPPVTQDYFLSTVNYCYLDRDTITINVLSPPPVDAGPLDSICLGDAPYQLNAQPDSLDLYLWTTTDPTITDVNIGNPFVSPLIDTWYYIYAEEYIGSLVCDSRDSVLILAYDTPRLALSYPLDYVGYICLGDSLELTATTNDGIYFDWTSDNGTNILNANTPIATVVPIDSTMFYHTTTNIHACSTTDSIYVNVQLPVTASVSGDSIMCYGFFADLQGNGGLYYHWYPNEDGLFSNSTYSVTQAYPDSTITIFVDVANDCFNDTAYHTITVYQLPNVDAGEDITIYRDETGFLNGSGAGSPVWYTVDRTIDGIVSSPYTYNPEMSPFNTTDYILEITDDATGCKNYDTARVNVDVLTLLAFPTGFSPNGDGVNDIAKIIKYLNIEKLIDFTIYDRWGEIVFKTEDISKGWDGTYKGRDVEIGMYAWMINAQTKDNEKITKSGNITIIR